MVRLNRLKLTWNNITTAFGVAFVLLTLILIMDLQFGFNLSNDYLPLPEYDANTIKGMQYQSFQNEKSKLTSGPSTNRFGLQNIEKLRKFFGNRPSDNINDIFKSTDLFEDLYEASEYIAFKKSQLPKPTEPEFVRLGDLVEYDPSNLTILDRFNLEIKQNEMYSENSKILGEILNEMATGKIVNVDQQEGGTQLKMKINFESGISAVVKSMRFPRDTLTLPNHIYYADYERHTAEIAAFHLDKLLGFRRVTPVTGRSLNVTTEIYELSEPEFKQTFFVSPQPDSNLCFYGICRRYCDPYHPFCAKNDMLENAFMAFFPTNFNVQLMLKRHPWRRSYSISHRAQWELDPNYCERVKDDEFFSKGRRLLDLMDLSVFDFLSGNMDRHHFGYFDILGDEAFLLHYDNGRGFGEAFHDEKSILMPVIHCCMIRQSTLDTLLRFHNGPKSLSQHLKESLASDPIAPVLWEPFYEAIDRRLAFILETVRDCIKKKAPHDVIYPGCNIEDKL